MKLNFKSFFLFLSTFLLSTQFATCIHSDSTQQSYYAEQVTEAVLLEKQEGVFLFAQCLLNQIVELKFSCHSPFIGLQFNHSLTQLQFYHGQQQLALNHQKLVQLIVKSDDYLFHSYLQSRSKQDFASVIFQLS